MMRLKRAAPFVAFAFALLAIKLDMTAGIRIVALAGLYDDSNYVSHALSISRGAWFGPYDQYALIKMPFFPIFLATISGFGLPLPIAHQLLYFGAVLVACIAVRPLVSNTPALCALFTILLFNPYTFDADAWRAERSNIAGSLALACSACAIALLLRERASLRTFAAWSIGLAVSFSAFWLTREESPWIVPELTILLVATVLKARERAKKDFLARLGLCALAPVACALSVSALCAYNGARYGWPTIVENQSPEFLGAFDSLARIAPASDPLLPVTTRSLAIAERVSPAASELRAGFARGFAKPARAYSCSMMHLCDGIAAGWFVWALRDAVARAGETRSGSQARAFYTRLAYEIDRACGNATIACKPKSYGLITNVTLAVVRPLLHNLRIAITYFFLQPEYALTPDFAHYNYTYEVPMYLAIVGPVVTAFPVATPMDGVLSRMASSYRVTTAPLCALAVAAILLRLARAIRRRRVDDETIVLVALFAGIAALLATLATVSTFLFTAFFTEYFSTAYPLLYLAIALSGACAISRRVERTAHASSV